MTSRTAPPGEAPGRLLYRALMGSHAYGTATTHSDEDWRGVFLLPSDDFLGLTRPKVTHELKPDQVYWELGQFCNLLLKGNPNMVGMLWAPPDCVVDYDEEVLGPLFVNRNAFVHVKTVEAYVGWAEREMREIIKTNANKGDYRDYSKRLSHVPRLLWEIEGAVTRHEVPVRQTGEHLRTIMAIKTGDLTFQESMDLCGELLLDVEQVVERELPNLPGPPTEWTREYLLSAREEFGR